MNDLPTFDVRVDWNGRAAAIVPVGEIDISTISRLQAARQEVLDARPAELTVDLRSVLFIDSTGLKFLLETYWLAQEKDFGFQVTRPAETVMKAFTVSGADRHLPFVEGGS